jgi:hypothetical protein
VKTRPPPHAYNTVVIIAYCEGFVYLAFWTVVEWERINFCLLVTG